MSHIDEIMFEEGVNGTRKAINFLRDLRDMLAGKSTNRIKRTVKYDGAPAVFIGIDPSDGKFFVAKKGIFNKNPKLYKSTEDIANDVASGDLRNKLTIAYNEFSKLGLKHGVIQGDLMFTKNDLKRETIDGMEYITFHPNTIVYAVPADSIGAKKITLANIGVVWHTMYEGKTLEDMNAKYGEEIVKHLKTVPTIWQMDANYHDVSGLATFTDKETESLTALLSETGRLFQRMPGDYLNMFKVDHKIQLLIKTFVNSRIKSSLQIDDPNVLSKEFIHYILDRYKKEIESKKKEETRIALENEMKNISQMLLREGPQMLTNVFQLMVYLARAKQIIIEKMSLVSRLGTFLKTSHNGFITTRDEGYVAIDHLGKNAVKLVDRMEFSRANFSKEILRGWEK